MSAIASPKGAQVARNDSPLALVYEEQPADFFPNVEIGAAYVDVNGKFLLLELAPGKQEAGAWGVPAGKMEMHETPAACAKRELFEETGINTPSETLFQPIGSLYIRKPGMDYTFHLFLLVLDQEPDIQLSSEHQAYKWVTQEEAEALHLMQGAKEALDFCCRQRR